MPDIKKLFENNKLWSLEMQADDPEFFKQLSKQQAPEYLWIGCSDSRVPANEIIGLAPGEVFVHRNVANLVIHTDFNCLSVVQFAVEMLKVKHIIVCGHYGCGGVRTAMKQTEQLGLIDNWLRHIKDVYNKHRDTLDWVDDLDARSNLLCELNIIEQVQNVCQTTIVQEAWRKGHKLSVHGWVYGLSNGLLKDLQISVNSQDEIDPVYRTATAGSLKAK